MHVRRARSLAILALAVVVAAVATAQAPEKAPRKVALKAARLIDGTGAAPMTNAVVLIEGDRITAVGSGLAIPKGYEVVDLGMQTLLPGRGERKSTRAGLRRRGAFSALRHSGRHLPQQSQHGQHRENGDEGNPGHTPAGIGQSIHAPVCHDFRRAPAKTSGSGIGIAASRRRPQRQA